MLWADWYYKQAILALRKQDINRGIENYQKAIMFQPEEFIYRQSFAQDLLNMVDSISEQKQADKIKFLDLAIGVVNDIPAGQQTFEVKSYQSRMYALRGKTSQKKEDFQAADQIFQNLIQLSPNSAIIYYDWCNLKIFEKNWSEATTMCLRSLNLYPNLNHPDLHYIHRQQIVVEMIQVYEKMGQIYFEQKKYDKALENYWAILHLRPTQYHIYKKIADVYYLRKDLETALRYNLRGYTLNSRDSNWPWAIALLYYEKGNLKMAKEYGQKALELAPENQMIKNFLEKLK